jgi:hypothetical protein
MKKFLGFINSIWKTIEEIQTQRAEKILADHRSGLRRWQ